MNWVLHLLQNLYRWFQERLVPPYRTCFIEDDDVPKLLQEKTIYIVQEDGILWHVSMLCPCGCGETLYLNLIPDERPCWRLTKHHNKTVSLYPSVWRKIGCYSHFWFRRGRVVWVTKTNWYKDSSTKLYFEIEGDF